MQGTTGTCLSLRASSMAKSFRRSIRCISTKLARSITSLFICVPSRSPRSLRKPSCKDFSLRSRKQYDSIQSLLLTLAMHEPVPVQSPQYFAKFFSGKCHVTLCGAGEHRIGSQMTEGSRLLTRLRRPKEVSEAVRAFTNHMTV